jgi:hypothetical protein
MKAHRPPTTTLPQMSPLRSPKTGPHAPRNGHAVALATHAHILNACTEPTRGMLATLIEGRADAQTYHEKTPHVVVVASLIDLPEATVYQAIRTFPMALCAQLVRGLLTRLRHKTHVKTVHRDIVLAGRQAVQRKEGLASLLRTLGSAHGRNIPRKAILNDIIAEEAKLRRELGAMLEAVELYDLLLMRVQREAHAMRIGSGELCYILHAARAGRKPHRILAVGDDGRRCDFWTEPTAGDSGIDLIEIKRYPNGLGAEAPKDILFSTLYAFGQILSTQLALLGQVSTIAHRRIVLYFDASYERRLSDLLQRNATGGFITIAEYDFQRKFQELLQFVRANIPRTVILHAGFIDQQTGYDTGELYTIG